MAGQVGEHEPRCPLSAQSERAAAAKLTVFKYPMKLAPEVTVDLPAGAEMLTVQMQAGIPCLWARVNPESPPVPRRLTIRGTGYEDAGGRYLATFQMDGGTFVFHVFEAP